MTKKSVEESEKINENKSKIRSWARGFHILCVIEKVLLYISVIALLGATFLLPGIIREVKIDDEQITIFDEKIDYEIKDVNFLKITHNNKSYNINSKKVLLPVVEKLKELSNNKLSKIITIIFVFSIITIILYIIILKKVDSILVRMKEEEKAFVKGGSDTIVKIMYFLIAILIIRLIGDLVISFVLKVQSINIHFDVSIIIQLLIVYFISLIYKNGELLEEK